MIDAQTIIAMIEWRQKQRSFLKRMTKSEPSPRHIPMFQLWQTPEYLIYLVETEVAALRSAGFSEPQAVDQLGQIFQLDPPAGTLEGLVQSLLRKHFPDYLAANEAHIPEMRRLAAQAEREARSGSYPPAEWLGAQVSPKEFRARMGKSLKSLSIFPRSEFDAQLLHFVIMMAAGGQIYEFSSPAETWRLMMGRGGLALVKDGRSLAFVETLMN